MTVDVICMTKDERDKQMILDILDGNCHYGRVKITKRKISKNITWIGQNGYTASVGQWIRTINKLVSEKKLLPRQGFRWYCKVDENGRQEKQEDHMWYFGIEFPKGDEHHIYVCGGTTDFSGEGGRGKELAETFLRLIVPENRILTRCADYLISELVVGE